MSSTIFAFVCRGRLLVELFGLLWEEEASSVARSLAIRFGLSIDWPLREIATLSADLVTGLLVRLLLGIGGADATTVIPASRATSTRSRSDEKHR